MSINGDPEGPPYKVGYAITDTLTAQTLTTGVLGAIMHYERTGQGQHIETSLLESALYAQSYVAASQLMGNTEYTRRGNEHPLISPYTVYKTKDDYIVVGVATDLQFVKFCKVLGMDQLSNDPKFQTNAARL